MTEPKRSQQKVKLEHDGTDMLEENRGSKGHRFGLQYTRTDIADAKPGMKAFKLATAWTAEEKAFVKSLKAGAELVVNKVEREYTDKDGSTRSTWDIDTVADVKSYQPKPAKKPWDNNYKKSSWTPQDNLSAKVGGLVHDAVGLYSAIEKYGLEVVVQKVGEATRALLAEAYAIEAEAATGVFKATSAAPVPSTGKSKVTPLPKKPDDYFPNVDEVDW